MVVYSCDPRTQEKVSLGYMEFAPKINKQKNKNKNLKINNINLIYNRYKGV